MLLVPSNPMEFLFVKTLAHYFSVQELLILLYLQKNWYFWWMTVSCFKTVSQTKIPSSISTSCRPGLHDSVAVTAKSKDTCVTSDTHINRDKH